MEIFAKNGEVYAKKYIKYYYLMSGDTNELFHIMLLQLYDHEKDLNDGRFKYFIEADLEYLIILSFKNNEYLDVSLEPIIDWIADQKCSWNIVPYSITREAGKEEIIRLSFTFDNPVIAVAFKLVWDKN